MLVAWPSSWQGVGRRPVTGGRPWTTSSGIARIGEEKYAPLYMNEEAKEETKKRVSWRISIPSVLLILYAISGWPYYYLIGIQANTGKSSIAEWSLPILKPIMAPHSWLRFHSEWYYIYTNSAVHAGGPNVSLPEWHEIKP